MLETKILVNSTISDAKQGARMLCADIKDFFLATPMSECEYMKVHIKHMPEDIIDLYKLNGKKTNDNYIYIRIKKGMYGLKQAAVLAYQQLKKVMEPHGYEPIPGTAGMWKHVTRRTVFCTCVDDSALKYFSASDAEHFLRVLDSKHKYTVDWAGSDYCGLHLDWNYDKGFVDVSMPGYVRKSL